jgi:hypothetical protein
MPKTTQLAQKSSAGLPSHEHPPGPRSAAGNEANSISPQHAADPEELCDDDEILDEEGFAAL